MHLILHFYSLIFAVFLSAQGQAGSESQMLGGAAGGYFSYVCLFPILGLLFLTLFIIISFQKLLEIFHWGFCIIVYIVCPPRLSAKRNNCSSMNG